MRLSNDQALALTRQGEAATLTWHAKPFAHASPITFEELRGLVAEFTQALREWERARAENYYTILGVARTASDDEIQHAYRMRAKHLHPDTSETDTTAAMQQINEAYAVLSDPQQRQQYDQTR